MQGLDHSRSEFEGDFDGNTVKGVTVLNGDKGWRKFGDNPWRWTRRHRQRKAQHLPPVIPTTLVPLKGKGFKIESAAEEKVGDKPAAGIKVTGPDGKDFKLYLRQGERPARQAGGHGRRFRRRRVHPGDDLRDYKDFDGIKKATRSRANATARNSWTGDHRSSRSWTRCPRSPSPSPNEPCEVDGDSAAFDAKD